MQKITPFLWFDKNAEEAMEFYVSIFDDAKIISKSPGPDGKLMGGTFELAGQQFMVLNGGPEYKFNEAISLMISCKDQKEIDYFWENLSAVPASEQCGWCKDKYGLSWQVVPDNLGELLQKPDAFTRMMKMKKIVIADF